MRSATMRAAARSWVTNSTAMPSSRRSRPRRLSTVAASDTSSALVGSSHSSTSGGTTVARASATRWRCPPESCIGFAPATCGGKPDQAERVRDPLRARSPGRAPSCRSRSPTSSPTVIHGVSEAPGVLEHHLRAGRPGRARSPRRRAAGARRWTRSSVDLPQPLSPTSATASPSHQLEIDPAQRVEAPAVQSRADLEALVDVVHEHRRRRTADARLGRGPRRRHRFLERRRADGSRRTHATVREPAGSPRRTPTRAERPHTRRPDARTVVRTRSPAAGAGGPAALPRRATTGLLAVRVEQAAGSAASRPCRDGAGRSKTSSGRPDLGQPPAVEHGDAVRDLGGHAEVVGDEDEAAAELAAQRREQVQDLCLDGHVERGGRLVGDDEGRASGDGHGDHDPLAEPSRELVRDRHGGVVEDRARRPRRAVGPPRRSSPPPRRPGDRPASSGLSEVIGSWNTAPR